MRDPGRISAAIEVLHDIEDQARPAKAALKDWGAAHRFAGAKDRAWISGLVLDALRRRRSLSHQMSSEEPRALVLGVLRCVWGWEPERIAAAVAEEPHGPGPLSASEAGTLNSPFSLDGAPAPVAGDYPDWLDAHMARVFGEARAQEGAALSARAGVDLRVNTLKSDRDKALKALATLDPAPSDILTSAVRLAPPAPEMRAGHIESIPAYAKGWVEVQDLGSQIAAAAAGDIKGAQVLDYCAGGGGKTLALAAQMAGTGQIYAYDSDPRRLAPTFERAQRAGLRGLQVRSPADGGTLDDLANKMDVVFVDAPCTGSGVWRRQPDAKWRLREGQLARRLEEQDAVLDASAAYVKPGGRLVYVTCSVLAEENEDRLAAFRTRRRDFAPASALTGVRASGLLAPSGLDALRACAVADGSGALRLTPHRLGTDGFFICVVQRAAE